MRWSNSKLVYGGLFAASAVFSVAKLVLYARLVGPTEYGVLSLALMISGIAFYFATAGVLEGFACEIPRLVGEGQDTVHVRSSVLTACILSAGLLGGGLTLGCLVLSRWYPALRGLPWTGAYLFSTVALSSLLCDLQVREKSVHYALVLLAKNALAPIVAFPLSAWGASGILCAEVLATLGCGALCYFLFCRDLGFRWSLPAVQALARIGASFTATNLAQNLSLNLDRWAVQIALGVSMLGAYAFALGFSGAGLIVLSMVQLYVGPRLLRRYGASRDLAEVFSIAGKLALGLLSVIVFVLIPSPWISDYILRAWFPQYLAAQDLLIWVFVGAGAMCLGFYDVVFRAVSDGKYLVAVQLLTLFLFLGACIAAISSGAALLTYAKLFAASRVFSAAAGWYLAWRLVCARGAAGAFRKRDGDAA